MRKIIVAGCCAALLSMSAGAAMAQATGPAAQDSMKTNSPTEAKSMDAKSMDAKSMDAKAMTKKKHMKKGASKGMAKPAASGMSGDGMKK